MLKANDYQVGGNHYASKIQHWDYVLANKIPYLEAMAIKYLTRWRNKGGHEDVKKAYHFLLKLAESEGIDLRADADAKPDEQCTEQDSGGQAFGGPGIPGFGTTQGLQGHSDGFSNR